MRNESKMKKLMIATLTAIYFCAALPSLQACGVLPQDDAPTSGKDDSIVSTGNWGAPTEDGTATALIANNYTPNSQQIYLYGTGLLEANLKGVGGISAPENTSYGSVIAYTVRPNTGNSRGYYYANFLNLSTWYQTPNTMVTNPAPDGLHEKYKDIDWTNAYISFWMYNDTDIVVSIYGTDNDFDDPDTPTQETEPTKKTESIGKKACSLKPKSWTKVNLSLKTYCDVVSDVFSDEAFEDYNVKLWLRFTDERVTTENCTGNETWSFYMTGFEFTSGSDSK